MAKKKKRPVKSGGLKAIDTGGTKKRRKTKTKAKKTITVEPKVKQYVHEKKKRKNNPPVGLVTSKSDPDLDVKKYSFDSYDNPQLNWSGKVETSDFEVDTVSLHRHEKIDPITIISKVLKNQNSTQQTLFPFFEKPENILKLTEAVEFYKHDQNWSNRLIAGDSLLVMNSLLEKEPGMKGSVQMIYVDPPYGKEFNSNFQPFVNQKKVKDGNDDDLSQEPETIKAFRDTWELGIHSFLTYLRDRLLLARDLLADEGSIFLQISDDNLHHIREIMDEIFGPQNFIAIITFQTATNQNTNTIQRLYDHIVWYGKTDHPKIKSLFRLRTKAEIESTFSYIDKKTGKRYKAGQIKSELDDKQKKNLRKLDRLTEGEKYIKRFFDDFEYVEFTNVWTDTVISTFSKEKIYTVQTNTRVIERCMQLVTDPGDLVLDPTCGSGTTAYVAEKCGRRWITCDTSRVTLALTRWRLMTAIFDYYKLAYPDEGVQAGFECTSVQHITANSITNAKPTPQEILYDQPIIDENITRITGPFTVEAIPSPTVRSIDTEFEKNQSPDPSIARSPENKRQQDWRDEILSTGVRISGNKKIEFTRIEPDPTSKWVHAIGETNEKDPRPVAVSFGPIYSPLDQRQVENAIAEARKFVPTPELIIFASVQFSPEASKDIKDLKFPGVEVIPVVMNPDLLTLNLKKNKTSNESFWLMGQPDVEVKKQKDGKYTVEVKGFDYYDTKAGEVQVMSGDSSKIAMWMLDIDYDERSLYPHQFFFPLSNSFATWDKLAKALKSEIDEELIEQYSGTKSLPFSAGTNNQVAVKIIDIAGIESLRIIPLE